MRPEPLSGLHGTLVSVLERVDAGAARARDPVRFAHRFAAPEDQAVVALYAALLAYGRVVSIGRALEDATARMGPTPFVSARDDTPEDAARRFDGFVYRLTRGEDLARLWIGIGHQARAGRTLEDVFMAGDAPGPTDYRTALAGFRRALVAPTAATPPRRAFEHFLPDPERGSATKRLWLFLRWMVRGPDAVDLGLWRRATPARLLIPVDTHIHRLATYLGLTERASADLRTAVEITEALRRIDAQDPVRFDFALTHLGIAGDCLRRPEPAICGRCPLVGACRHGTARP